MGVGRLRIQPIGICSAKPDRLIKPLDDSRSRALMRRGSVAFHDHAPSNAASELITACGVCIYLDNICPSSRNHTPRSGRPHLQEDGRLIAISGR